MKITDLNKFSFYIGNTSEELDVIATNEGILVDDELVATYEDDANIESVEDLEEVINDAIMECDSFTDEDCEGLSEVLYNDASLDIENWWKKNYE